MYLCFGLVHPIQKESRSGLATPSHMLTSSILTQPSMYTGSRELTGPGSTNSGDLTSFPLGAFGKENPTLTKKRKSPITEPDNNLLEKYRVTTENSLLTSTLVNKNLEMPTTMLHSLTLTSCLPSTSFLKLSPGLTTSASLVIPSSLPLKSREAVGHVDMDISRVDKPKKLEKRMVVENREEGKLLKDKAKKPSPSMAKKSKPSRVGEKIVEVKVTSDIQLPTYQLGGGGTSVAVELPRFVPPERDEGIIKLLRPVLDVQKNKVGTFLGNFCHVLLLDVFACFLFFRPTHR